ncbi:MAG: hypothetical protein QF605_03695, partial [Rhodospirillales bacterium]|nr:hypothetical protein [Rhodospirillales bacterium]
RITNQIKLYQNAEVVWCQEEASNQGAWHFAADRIDYILESLDKKAKQTCRVLYVGRTASASPAVGSLKVHNKEQELLVEQALNGKAKDLIQPFMPIKHGKKS